MCGLAGVVAFDQALQVDRPCLIAMSARIAHRGPDGQGTYITPPGENPLVAFTHRRLAILDPDERSNQPFIENQYVLVFNGEIYNFREIRRALSSRSWKTEGDTEVLLAAYQTWGENCVEHLNGMFAFAVWDGPRRRLFLARDRLGQKPLFYAMQRGSAGSTRAVAFASEIGALLPLPWVDQSIDPAALAEYLRWGYTPCPLTLFSGIQQLAPAQTLTITQSGVVAQTYFHAAERAALVSPVEQTRKLVLQAVQRQMVSDVPLGCFLSGGVDSSVIAAAIKSAVPPGQKILTFSIGFEDARYDETRYAAQVAAHLGTQHESFTVHPDAAADLPKLAAQFGEPMADSSCLPTHYLSLKTRERVKVALSGDGGDELFGGYDRYRALNLSAARLPWKYLQPLVALLPGSHPKSSLSRIKRLVASANLPESLRYSAYMRLIDESLLRSLLIDFPKAHDHDLIAGAYESARLRRGPMETAMAVDRQTYLPHDVLTKVDRCSMLHALEVRSPFLDHDLVNFASGLNSAQLLGGRKRLLRAAFAGDLPASVFTRRKMGFAVPIGDWLRNSLRPMLNDLLFAADSLAAKYFNRDVLTKMVDDHQQRKTDHSQRLYALLMLELWQRGLRK